MTNNTIYRKAQELPFVQFCKWYNRAVRKRKTRDSNSAENEPFCVALRNEANKKKVRLEKSEGEAYPTYEDAD
tara:strand:- start:714 stop:932 length:219 start_codon:yes stop_codon:yes gene_type:complete